MFQNHGIWVMAYIENERVCFWMFMALALWPWVSWVIQQKLPRLHHWSLTTIKNVLEEFEGVHFSHFPTFALKCVSPSWHTEILLYVWVCLVPWNWPHYSSFSSQVSFHCMLSAYWWRLSSLLNFEKYFISWTLTNSQYNKNYHTTNTKPVR